MTSIPTPIKPWKATKRERLIDVSIFILALLSLSDQRSHKI